jgi:hypothetical protein
MHNAGRKGFLPAQKRMGFLTAQKGRDSCRRVKGKPVRAQMWTSALHEHGFAGVGAPVLRRLKKRPTDVFIDP